MTVGRMMSVSRCPATGTRASSTSPARLTADPRIDVTRMPASDTSAGAAAAATRIDRPNGTYASPVRSAE